MVLRASGGPSILRDELSDEQITMEWNAVRLNAAASEIQVFVGANMKPAHCTNIPNWSMRFARRNTCMGVTAVGKTLTRDASISALPCRRIAELGAQYVKTYYVEEGSKPSPLVSRASRDGRMARSCRNSTPLTMAYNAVNQGAAGVDMGRNIFQSDAPKAMIAAVNAVVAQQHQAGRGARNLQVA